MSGPIVIWHLSDVHASSTPLYGTVDGLGRLRAAVDQAARAERVPDAIVVAGDLVQVGHHDQYPAVLAELDRAARSTGAVVLAVPGNHDDPARLADPRTGSAATVRMVRGLRLVALDSSTGRLGERQLDWLRSVLAQPAPAGTVLVLHHPPVPSPLPGLRDRGLADADRLAVVVAGSDVRVVLAGHYHHPMSGLLAGVPVWAGPALAYQQIVAAGPGRVSGQDLALFSLVQIDRSQVTAVPVALYEGTPLFTVPAGSVTQAVPAARHVPSPTYP